MDSIFFKLHAFSLIMSSERMYEKKISLVSFLVDNGLEQVAIFVSPLIFL